MSRTFNLTERMAGFVIQTAGEGEQVQVLFREALTSLDGAALTWRLEELHDSIFSRIPELPLPSQIDHLLVVIAPDLTATAYVNELNPVMKAKVKAGRQIQAGEPIYAADIHDLESYDLRVSIPSDHAVVVVRSHGWRRALFYDFGPLRPSQARERNYDLSAILAEQTLSLLMDKFSVRPSVAAMQQAITELQVLLRDRCTEESRYQELLEQYPWFLGAQHTLIERHTSLDDRNIPDFTGVRAHDGVRDLFEIKQPFLQCFRRDDNFSAKFHEAWDQAERYLTFVRNNKGYLRSEKDLVFNNPRCFLLVGSKLSAAQLRKLQEREAHNPSISVLTYEQVLRLGQSLLALVQRAAESEATATPD